MTTNNSNNNSSNSNNPPTNNGYPDNSSPMSPNFQHSPVHQQHSPNPAAFKSIRNNGEGGGSSSGAIYGNYEPGGGNSFNNELLGVGTGPGGGGGIWNLQQQQQHLKIKAEPGIGDTGKPCKTNNKLTNLPF